MPRPLSIAIRPKADEDLDIQFWHLVKEAGIDTAFRFEAAWKNSIETLADMPGVGVIVPNTIVPNLRRWPVRDFENILFFYRYDTEKLYLLRVLHGMRDLDNILEDSAELSG